MPKFLVYYDQTVTYVAEYEAENHEQAIEIAKKRLEECDDYDFSEHDSGEPTNLRAYDEAGA